jgi:hypothetical protein
VAKQRWTMDGDAMGAAPPSAPAPAAIDTPLAATAANPTGQLDALDNVDIYTGYKKVRPTPPCHAGITIYKQSQFSQQPVASGPVGMQHAICR